MWKFRPPALRLAAIAVLLLALLSGVAVAAWNIHPPHDEDLSVE